VSVHMAGIKTCQQCCGLYTGRTPLCAGCYFASLPVPSLSPVPKSRAERRALAKREAKAERRSIVAAQRVTREAWIQEQGGAFQQAPSPVKEKNANPKQQKQLSQPVKRNCDSAAKVAVPAVSICYFCSQRVERDRMKTHLREAHRRDPYGAPIPESVGEGSIFAFSGGLPSLGKRR
jgi:hypothetical protein